MLAIRQETFANCGWVSPHQFMRRSRLIALPEAAEEIATALHVASWLTGTNGAHQAM